VTRTTSPIPFQIPDKTLLRSSRTARAELPLPDCEDCSRLRFLRQRIKQKDQEFASTLREKAKLLGIAVHDLRLPVAAIEIYSELLAESIAGKASPEEVEWIDSIRSVSRFALRLLEETLDLALAESGAIRLHPSPATLAPIVRKSVTMTHLLAVRRQMNLTLVEEGEPRLVLADSVKMSKVFNNLIENAIKHCEPGTRIEVRVSHRKDEVLVSVHDDGPGIDPADLKTLFTPFQRTRARALSEEPSAGLGLAIAKQIVDLHGGRIGVQSEVGLGTTFFVSLPA